MQNITIISTDILKVHPRNIEFFDDISGEEYERFKKSIQEDGILSPILVSPDMTIISGHQRVKACRDLSIKLVPVIIREDLTDEDEKLKKLLVANFGRSKNDPVKQGRVYDEYAKLRGVRQGSANPKGTVIGEGDNRPHVTQEDIAKELGVSVRHLKEIKQLTTLSPELQDLISEGKITATTGYKVLSKLSKAEQEELIRKMNPENKYTQTQVQEYIDTIKKLEDTVIKVSEQKIKTEIIREEVDKPQTLEQIANLKLKLNQKDEQYKVLFAELLEKQKLLNTAMGDSTNYQLISSCSEITLKMLNFIKEMAKYDYMAESFNEIPYATRIEYMKCVNAVQKWANRILDTIESGNTTYQSSDVIDVEHEDTEVVEDNEDNEVFDPLAVLRATNEPIDEFQMMLNRI